jgi:uncharacterized protein YndB with AHSA1/START domain
MIDGDRVVHEARYPHPVPAVWEALTDPAALSAWLMPNDFVATVGHRFQLDARPGFDLIPGEVLDVEPPSLLRCRWTIEGIPTTVTFRLEATGEGTRLELEHVRLPPSTLPNFDGGWTEKLDIEIGLVLTRVNDPTRATVDDGLYRYPGNGT